MSFGKFLGSFVGIIVAGFGLATLGDHLVDENREEQAIKNVAATFNEVAVQTPDSAMPGKQIRLKEIYHHLSKYYEPEASYLVQNGIHLNLSAAMEDALFKIDQDVITINAKTGADLQKWKLPEAVSFIRSQKDSALPYQPTCLKRHSVGNTSSLVPTACP